MNIASPNLELEVLEIGHLEYYNEDLDQGNPPQAWVQFRNKIKNSDGFLFFTPEYNRGIPAVLKNAIDVASRPYGQNSWAGKPGAVTPKHGSWLNRCDFIRHTMSDMTLGILK